MSYLMGRREVCGLQNCSWAAALPDVQSGATCQGQAWELERFELSAVFSSSSASTYGTCQSRLEAIQRLARRGDVWVAQHMS